MIPKTLRSQSCSPCPPVGRVRSPRHSRPRALLARCCRAGGWLGLLTALALSPAALGQTVQFRAARLRVTVPVQSTQTLVLSNYAVLTGVSSPVNLDVSGLPAGATYSLNPTALSASGPVWLTLNLDNVAEGEYTFSLDATGGAVNNLLLTLQVAHFWSGTDGVVGYWSSPGSWLGGQIPDAASDVVFSDLGGQTALFTNCIVDTDATVASLRFATTNTTAYHTLHIQPGRTLTVVGPGGLRLLRDYVNEYAALGNAPTVNIVGENARLVVSNATADVALTLDGMVRQTLRMDGLDTFVADVNRVALADFSAYPNFWNLQANGYNGVPRRFLADVYFARTNIIIARYVNPDHYTNSDTRRFSLCYASSAYSGTTTIRDIYLGISNAFFMDSVCFIGANQQGRVQFNPAFATNNPVAIFRNTDGGRMSVFAVSDESGTNFGSGNVKSWLYFGNNNGSVDILADQFYIARDRQLLSGDPNFQGQMYIGRGIVDVNTAVLGFQDGGTRTNTGTFRGYCQGTLGVSNTAVFKVNHTLELGYTTESNTGGEPWNTRGTLIIGPGGTVMANTILVGGVTKLSANNTISLSGGAQLILSNTVAGPDKKLTSLTINNGTLVLHVDGNRTEPYIYVTNLTASGTANRIQLARIENVAAYPAQLPLIAYDTAAASFALRLPAGFYGYLLNNAGTKTIDAVITTNPPPQVVWNGTVNGNWDTTTANWKDGLLFQDGAPVTFDDTAAGTTTITVVDAVAPGEVLVTNQTKAYSFAGGTIAGTSLMTKRGSGSLTMDATSELPLALDEGSVTGSGALGVTTVAAGATLNFTGGINGLISAGTAAVSGTINNGIQIQGGSFVSSGTINGPVTISGGTASLNGTVNATGTASLAAGATLVLDGRFNNVSTFLNVNGTLAGSGVVSDVDGYNFGNEGRLAINSGATLSPGHSLGVFSVEGRFDLNPNARLIVEVDLNHPARNDIVAVDVFGNIRGIIVMTNVGTAPFAVGQSFQIVSNNFNLANTPLNPNLDFSFEPASPGLGMLWDGSELATNGIVKIVPIPTTSPQLTSVVAGNQLTLSWPETHIGWVLQQQVRALTNGLSVAAQDWTVVAASRATNSITVPINPGNPAVFYRLAHP